MKIQSKYMYGGKSTYRKGGYIPQTQMSKEELDKKAYGSSKGPQKLTRKDVEPQTKSKRKNVKPQTQMTRKELDNLASKKEKSKTTTNNNKVNNKQSKTSSKIYNLKNDKNWEYKVEDNKWFTRKKGTTKFFDLSGDKFKSAVEKLDKEHPNARTRTMEKGGTLMQRYAKAYQEGGTPDSLLSRLEKFEEDFGIKLPTYLDRNVVNVKRKYTDADGERVEEDRGVNILQDIAGFVQHMKNSGKLKGNIYRGETFDRMMQSLRVAQARATEDYLRSKNEGEMPDRGDIEKILSGMPKDYLAGKVFDEYLKKSNAYDDVRKLFARVRREAEQLPERLRELKESGQDVSKYNSYLIDPKSFNDYHYTGNYEKIENAKKVINQKLEDDPYVELTPAELYIIGAADTVYPAKDGDFTIKNEEGLIKQLKKQYDITVTPQNRSILSKDYFDEPQQKKSLLGPNNNVKTTLNEGQKTPGEQGSPKNVSTGPNLSSMGLTKIETKDDSELMANQVVPGPVSVDATTTDDSTVTETRDDTRKKVTEEYIPQSMRNIVPQTVVNRRNENNKPEDNTDKVETSVKTTNNNNVTSDTGMNTGDDFSGPNPYDYGSEEYFDWKKRKRAAMFAKRGALVKKINYLKGGVYGKRNFRR